MNRRGGVSVWLVVFSGMTLTGKKPEDGVRFFDARVAPILIKRCLPCHNEELKNGGISFLDGDSLLKGGKVGPAIVPGKPEESVLIHTIRRQGDLQMPPGPQLPAKEKAVLEEWIRRGAAWGKKLRLSK